MDLHVRSGRRTIGEELDRPLEADDGHGTLVDCVRGVDRRGHVAAGVGDMGIVEYQDEGHALFDHVVSEPVQPLAIHPTDVVGRGLFHRVHVTTLPHPGRP
jgi:hypothetical protein